LIATPAACASLRCLDYSEAARTWPLRAPAKDGEGCWTYDHPPRAEVSVAIHEPVLPAREPALVDRWVDADLIEVELHQREPDTVSQAEPSSSPDAIASQFALFVALVLATVSVEEIATVRGSAPGREARRWAAKSRR